MKNLPYAALAVWLSIALLTVAAFCPRAQSQSEVSFRLVNGNLIIVTLTAGQAGPASFILDTGADTTIIDPSLAARLSLVPLGPVQQSTLTGTRSVPRGLMAGLSAGSMQVENLPVMVQDLAAVRRIDSHIQGIAGQDFLSHFNYFLDYRHFVVRIEAASEIRDTIEGDRVQIELGGNRMIVASEGQALRHASLRLLLDSGASSLVLIHKGSQALDVPAFDSVQETTSSGSTSLRAGKVHKLTVGSEQFHDIAVALYPSDPAEPIGDGLLPTTLFQALYVNNREGFVVFNPKVRKN
jgi:predicted aspartyl protease